MPCFDAQDSRETFDPHNNPQAEMLCTVLSGMASIQLKNLPIDVTVWWKEHQRRDHNKKIDEQITEKQLKLKDLISKHTLTGNGDDYIKSAKLTTEIANLMNSKIHH